MIVIIDYEIGNIHSITQVLDHLGEKYLLTREKKDILKSKKLILPGVGAFGPAMSKLITYGLDKQIKKAAQNDCFILGICLGMQLLATVSYEDGKHEGLGLVHGEVNHFNKIIKGAKIPHVGFNSVFNHSGINILPKSHDADFYFTHSYFFSPLENIKTAVTNYEFDFVSAFQKENIFGVQFHPEKSQSNGINVFKKFIELKC